jgi:5-methylcytosine-specific restriction protein A
MSAYLSLEFGVPSKTVGKATSMFEIGRQYRRKKDLHERFGGQEQNGISTPSKYPLIFIFTGTEGQQYGYQDHWIDNETFEYFGEGVSGDMVFTHGNKAIRDHRNIGKSIHLFQKTQVGLNQYVDEMIYSAHRLDRGIDLDGNDREVIIFELFRKSAIDAEPDEPEVAAFLDGLDQHQLREAALDAATPHPSTKEAKVTYRYRSAAIKKYARARANGICEGCQNNAPFTTTAGVPYLEVHHVRSLSDGGPDDPQYVVAICPTCHRRAHYADDFKSFNEDLVEIAFNLEADI